MRAVGLRSVVISADIRRSRTLRSVCYKRAQREATHKYLSLVRAENAAGNVPLIWVSFTFLPTPALSCARRRRSAEAHEKQRPLYRAPPVRYVVGALPSRATGVCSGASELLAVS